MSSNVSTGHFRRTHGQSPHVLTVGAAESAPWSRSCRARRMPMVFTLLAGD